MVPSVLEVFNKLRNEKLLRTKKTKPTDFRLFCQDLTEFWQKLKISDAKERFNLVVAYSEKVYRNRRSYEARRKKKYPFWKNKLCQVCKVTRGVIMHHVVQVQNGGWNTGNNLLKICHNCHAEVHPWLKESIQRDNDFFDEAFRGTIAT